MQCRIISIGDELLLGDTVNTNASWMAQALTEAGIDVERIDTIKDDLVVIKDVLEEALSSVDAVITTGGLGPTHDDMTKRAVTELWNSELVVHEPTLSFIREKFKKRNIPFSKSNYHQAEVPADCEVLFNKEGTAPGMWFERDGHRLAVLPGVPSEMKHLMREYILPKLTERQQGTEVRRTHYLLTSGIGESTLSDEVIGSLENFLTPSANISVAYLPSPSGTRIRIRGHAASEAELDERLKPVVAYIRDRAKSYLAGEGKELQLAEVVGKLLYEQGLTVSTAESCTGGALSNQLTDIAGSSRYVRGGIVAYANDVKITELDVAADDIKDAGAVSKTVALQMARGVARKMDTDIGLSTTGIAGPGGGTNGKPVGMVWIGFWSRKQHFALRAQFTKDRLANKERTTAVALEMVRRVLLDIPEMPYGLKKQLA
ncbi:competence/damage-inducible protein A [Fodinibius sediminis]|uniref:CinA-like protein n=1 Tax=Fodinibius sediminis TaxID=1214077 RepID=A0A521DB27_9BACT|nr:competence/damage-inducible protein A [Fodinibius sediminis]SMO68927.1 competence/damage-inducible protein cinA [Fodinibius sediminis]